MLKRTVLLFILTALLICMVSVNEAKKKSKRKPKHGTKGMSMNDSTTCDEFSKYARFNPYSVLNVQWFVFYYWAPPRNIQIYTFSVPSANQTKYLHRFLNDSKVTVPVNWTARQVLMRDQNNLTSLLVERNDRGQYWEYILLKVHNDKIAAHDVRLRQTGDGRLLGFMDCKEDTMIVMSKINEVPPKNKLQEEAARLGFRGRRGKSYLYQGHEWMPIPEDDENNYWERFIEEPIPQSDVPKDFIDDVVRTQSATTEELKKPQTINDNEESQAKSNLKESQATNNAEHLTSKIEEPKPSNDLKENLSASEPKDESSTKSSSNEEPKIPQLTIDLEKPQPTIEPKIPQTIDTAQVTVKETSIPTTEAISRQQLNEPTPSSKIRSSQSTIESVHSSSTNKPETNHKIDEKEPQEIELNVKSTENPQFNVIEIHNDPSNLIPDNSDKSLVSSENKISVESPSQNLQSVKAE